MFDFTVISFSYLSFLAFPSDFVRQNKCFMTAEKYCKISISKMMTEYEYCDITPTSDTEPLLKQ